jgi:hypothetical protein
MTFLEKYMPKDEPAAEAEAEPTTGTEQRTATPRLEANPSSRTV